MEGRKLDAGTVSWITFKAEVGCFARSQSRGGKFLSSFFCYFFTVSNDSLSLSVSHTDCALDTLLSFLLSCPELRRLEIGRLAPEMFRDLPLEHLPLVTSKLEMLSLFNLPGTDEEWRSQQIVLSNILVTAGSNLTSIKLVTASIGLLQQINPAIEELALDSFGTYFNCLM